MPVFLAIAGQPATFAPMPPTAPAAALAAVSGLEERLSRRRLFGFLDPLVSASYDDGTLYTTCHRDLTRRGASRATIVWRWRQLWHDDGWYETGWHPDVMFHALLPSSRTEIWEAVNPGKRPWQGLAR